MRVGLTPASLLIALLGCGPVNDDSDPGTFPQGEAPDLTLSPSSIDFGQVAVGEVAMEPVTIENSGAGSLHIFGLELEGGGWPFSVSTLETVVLEPGDATYVVVSFEPEDAMEQAGRLVLTSDDPDTPQAGVELLGQGLGGDLEVELDQLGTILVGCDATSEVRVRNAGSEALAIEAAELTSEGELSFQLDSATHGALPWTLAPGEQRVLGSVRYQPLDEIADLSYLGITTDEPGVAETLLAITASASYAGYTTEKVQLEAGEVDVMIAVHGGTGMEDELEQLASHIGIFAEVMRENTSSFHISAVGSSHCIITSQRYFDESFSASEAEALFRQMIASAGSMPYITSMLDITIFHIIRPGECNIGSLREGNHWALLGVTNEVDQSSETAKTYISQVESKKGDDAFAFFGIAGDYPSGCSHADYSGVLYETVQASGGQYMSICASDYEDEIRELALRIAQMGWGDKFFLSSPAVEETIEITANGEPLEDGWKYDEEQGCVIFDSFPDLDAQIEISYAHAGTCG
jgi:hypothetical protein